MNPTSREAHEVLGGSFRSQYIRRARMPFEDDMHQCGCMGKVDRTRGSMTSWQFNVLECRGKQNICRPPSSMTEDLRNVEQIMGPSAIAFRASYIIHHSSGEAIKRRRPVTSFGIERRSICAHHNRETHRETARRCNGSLINHKHYVRTTLARYTTILGIVQGATEADPCSRTTKRRPY